MVNAIFKLAEGTDKARYNAPAQRRDHRFMFMSSTNTAVAEVAKAIGANTAQAVRVRLLTIPADTGAGLGVFDTLPRGCTDSADAVTQLEQLADQHYGWAARAFIERLEGGLQNSAQREMILRQLRTHAKRFMRMARIPKGNGEAHRAAEKFALVRAAGGLAPSRKVLPIDGLGV
ncbi:MAG TPA: hypothetical protein VEZ12_17395, partial [Herpetosiphonaceae bacterium]|nr:hypothetical protein [Herpetosiphonaceae bacterium]